MLSIRLVAMASALFAFIGTGHAYVPPETRPQFAILDWFPFGYTEQEAEKGMVFEMVETISTHLKVDFTPVLLPVPRVIRGMEMGEYDFTITYRDPDMMRGVRYLSDVGCLSSYAVSFKKKPVRTIEDLNGLRVAYPGGGYFVKRFLPHLNIDGRQVYHTAEMVKMALRGRLDAFIINDGVWHGYLQNRDPNIRIPQARWGEFADPFVMEVLPLAISVSDDSEHQALSEAIARLDQSAEFMAAMQDIFTAYGLPDGLKCLSP